MFYTEQTGEDHLGEAEQQHEGAVPDGHNREGQAAEPFAKDHTGNEAALQQVSNHRGTAPKQGEWKDTGSLLEM